MLASKNVNKWNEVSHRPISSATVLLSGDAKSISSHATDCTGGRTGVISSDGILHRHGPERWGGTFTAIVVQLDTRHRRQDTAAD